MIQMINNFQKSLSERPDVMWEIVKVFHPDMNDSFKNRLKFSFNYDWVLIHFKGFKDVSIGIRFESHLMSGPQPISAFKDELKNNHFGAWRFYTDSKFELEKKEEYIYLKTLYQRVVNSILKNNKISKPTAKQMSDYYHSD